MSSMPEVPNYRPISDTVFVISYILLFEEKMLKNEEAIARHFYSIHKFIMIAGFAHDKTVEELTAIASSNRNK